MKKFKLLAVMLSVLCVISFAVVMSGCSACNGNDNDDDVGFAFELTETEVEIDLGLTYQIRIKGGTSETITYVSANPDVASVNENGLVTGEKVGNTIISVTIKETTKQLAVSVYSMGDVPRIELCNVDATNVVRAFVNNFYTIEHKVMFKNINLDLPIVMTSSDISVVSIEGNKLTFNKLGSAVITAKATYKTWNIEKTFNVEVVDNVVVDLSEKNIELVTDKLITGQNNECDVSAEVSVDGQIVSDAVVVWKSEDENIATVVNGKISAKTNVGQTKIFATYTHNGIEYVGYVNVKVEKPYLYEVENIEFDKDTAIFSWDESVDADEYIVDVNGSKFNTSETFFDASDYYGLTYFSVTASSHNQNVSDSGTVSLNYDIKTKNLRKNLIDRQDSYESSVILQKSFADAHDGLEVFMANCTSDVPCGTPETYGYTFKKVFLVKDSISESIKGWCNYSLIPKEESFRKYVGSSISMWVYASEEFTLRYLSTIVFSGNEVISEVKVPAETWTRVSFTMSLDDVNNKVMSLITSSIQNFYFTDLRIAAFDYNFTDYSDLPFYELPQYADGRVFGDNGLSGAMRSYTGNDTWRATTEHTVSSNYSTYVGQNGYVYKGEHGNIAKVTVNIGTSGISFNGTPVAEDKNWGLVFSFNKVLNAMNATDSPNVRMYLYVNSSSNKWVQFGQSGTISRMAQSQSRAPGWHEIVFSKSDIENIVNNCPTPMIWNNNAELSLDSRSFELWISDFFLELPNQYADGRVFGDNGLSGAVSKYSTSGSYVLYRGKVESSVSSYYSTYVGQNDYVYDGTYGNIIKVNISQGTSGASTGQAAVPEDNNWGLVVKFDKILEAMNATDATSVTVNIYVNSSQQRWLGFGAASSTITRLGQCKYYAQGWNAITFTKADIQYIVENYSSTMIWNSNEKFDEESTFEIWVSDFFLEFPSQYADGRVFGDNGLSGAMSNYTGNDTWRATTEHTVSSNYSTYVGQGGYVYNGEYGNIAKVTVNIGTSGISYNGTPVLEDKNWGLVFSFNEVLNAMNATDAPNVRMYLYVNSSENKWVQFGQSGKISRMAQSQSRAPGWHEIVFSKSDIENIVNNCPTPMIWNNNAELSLDSQSFELWISDFFLTKTEESVSAGDTQESVSAGDTQIELSTVSKDTDFAGKQYGADVSFSVANDAEHGRIVKAAISKGSVGNTYDHNWAFSVNFGKVLEAMNNTGATSAKLYVYVNINTNDDIDPWVGFGDNATRINAGDKSIGWNEITFTKEQIEQLAGLSTALIWNSNAFKYQGNCTYFEIWISDFFLNV